MARKNHRRYPLEKASVVKRQSPEQVQLPGLLKCRNMLLSRSDLVPTVRPDLKTMGWTVESWSGDYSTTGNATEWIAGYYEMAETGAKIYITNMRLLAGNPTGAIVATGVYSDGTATVADAGVIVTGSGTEWFKKVWPGCWIKWTGSDALYRIDTVSGDLELTLEEPAAAAASGAYTIYRSHAIEGMYWPVRSHQFGDRLIYGSTQPAGIDPTKICGPFAADVSTSWVSSTEAFWVKGESLVTGAIAPRFLAMACWDSTTAATQQDVYWALENGNLLSSTVTERQIAGVGTDEVAPYAGSVVGLELTGTNIYAYHRDGRSASSALGATLSWSAEDDGTHPALPTGAYVTRFKGSTRMTNTAWVIIGEDEEDTTLTSTVSSACLTDTNRVVVGANGATATRSGAGVWADTSPSTTANFLDCCYMDDIDTVVVVGSDGHVWHSTDDGANWTDKGDKFSGATVHLVESNATGTACIAASADKMWISDDATTWTEITAETASDCVAIVWDGASSVFRCIREVYSDGDVNPAYVEVAVGVEYTIGDATSETNVQYTTDAGQFGAFDSINQNGTIMLLAGPTGVLRSTNGYIGPWAEPLATGTPVLGIEWSGGAHYVAVGDGTLHTSIDGVSWTSRVTGKKYFGVAYRSSETKFVAVGWDPSNGAVVSTTDAGPDLTAWNHEYLNTDITGPFPVEHPWCISDDGLYLGMDSGQVHFWNGSAWVTTNMPNYTQPISSIVVAPTHADGVKRIIIAVGDSSQPYLWNLTTHAEEQQNRVDAFGRESAWLERASSFPIHNALTIVGGTVYHIGGMGKIGKWDGEKFVYYSTTQPQVTFSVDGGITWQPAEIGGLLTTRKITAAGIEYRQPGGSWGGSSQKSLLGAAIIETTASSGDISVYYGVGTGWAPNSSGYRDDFSAPSLANSVLGSADLGGILSNSLAAYGIDLQSTTGRESLVGLSSGYVAVLDDDYSVKRVVDTGAASRVQDLVRYSFSYSGSELPHVNNGPLPRNITYVYGVGKAAVNSGGTVVTGQGTEWLTHVQAGDKISWNEMDDYIFTVVSVSTDTSLTMTPVATATITHGIDGTYQTFRTSGGTASVTIGTTAVTGVGVSWGGAIFAGQYIRWDNSDYEYEIASIDSPTTLTLGSSATVGETGTFLIYEKSGSLRAGFGDTSYRVVFTNDNEGAVDDNWQLESTDLSARITSATFQSLYDITTGGSDTGSDWGISSVLLLSPDASECYRARFEGYLEGGSPYLTGGATKYQWDFQTTPILNIDSDDGFYDCHLWDNATSTGLLIVGANGKVAKWDAANGYFDSTAITTPTTATLKACYGYEVSGTGEFIVAVGTNVIIYSEDDGDTWSAGTGDIDHAWEAVGYDSGMWIASSAGKDVAVSYDGKAWERMGASVVVNDIASASPLLGSGSDGYLYTGGTTGTAGYYSFEEDFDPLSDIYRGNAVVVAQNQVLLFGVTQYTETTNADTGEVTKAWKYFPRRVRRTAFGTYATFVEGEGLDDDTLYSGYGFNDLPGTGELWDAVLVGQDIVIAESDRLSVFAPTGSTSVPWSYTVIAEGLWPMSNMVVVNAAVYFVGQDGLLYQVQGARQVSRVGTPFDLSPHEDYVVTTPVAMDWDPRNQMLLIYISGDSEVHMVEPHSGGYTTLDIPSVTISGTAYSPASVLAAKSVEEASVIVSYVPTDGSSHTTIVAAEFGFDETIDGSDTVVSGTTARWVAEIQTGRLRESNPGTQAELSEVIVKTYADGTNRPIVGVQVKTTEDSAWHSVPYQGTLSVDTGDTELDGAGSPTTALSHKVLTTAVITASTEVTLPCPARKARLYVESGGTKTLYTTWTASGYTATLTVEKAEGDQLWCFWSGEPQQVGSVDDILEDETNDSFRVVTAITNSTTGTIDLAPEASVDVTLIPGQEMPSGDGILTFGLPREVDDVQVRIITYPQSGSTSRIGKVREIELVSRYTGEERTNDE